MIGRFLGRLVMVPLGLVLAALASGFVLFQLGMERLAHATHGVGADPAFWETVIDVLGSGLALAGAATLLPALLVVIVGEVARIRSALYYVAGGGAALAAIPLLARFGQSATPTGAATAIWQVLATAGFAGGLVYWLVAGRNA